MNAVMTSSNTGHAAASLAAPVGACAGAESERDRRRPVGGSGVVAGRIVHDGRRVVEVSETVADVGDGPNVTGAVVVGAVVEVDDVVDAMDVVGAADIVAVDVELVVDAATEVAGDAVSKLGELARRCSSCMPMRAGPGLRAGASGRARDRGDEATMPTSYRRTPAESRRPASRPAASRQAGDQLGERLAEVAEQRNAGGPQHGVVEHAVGRARRRARRIELGGGDRSHHRRVVARRAPTTSRANSNQLTAPWLVAWMHARYAGRRRASRSSWRQVGGERRVTDLVVDERQRPVARRPAAAPS